MLHTPVDKKNGKTDTDRTRTAAEPDQKSRTLAAGWVGPSPSTRMDGRLSAGAERYDQWAGLQRAYGNQAVLRMAGAEQSLMITTSSLGQGGVQATATYDSLSPLLRQPMMGNHTVLQRLVSTRPQAKLTISQPSDVYEREADRVAEQVVRMPDPHVLSSAVSAQANTACSLQRKRVYGGSGTAGECEASWQKQEAILQRRATTGVGPVDVPRIVHDVLRLPGQPLDAATNAFMEPRFGYDFSRVRVHADGNAAKSARAVQARAYTIGRDIVFGSGEYAPATADGKRLLAHELVHVIQQDAPAVRRQEPELAEKRSEEKLDSISSSSLSSRIRSQGSDADTASVRRFLSQPIHKVPEPVVARDTDDDEIDAIENEKLEISALLERCAGLAADQRDRMIGKAGEHAKWTHEERLLASLLAAKFKGVMKRADFYNTYHELLERLNKDQMNTILDYVGKSIIGKTPYTVKGEDGDKTVMIDKRSINDVGMRGAPGSSIRIGGVVYVVVDDGVQFKTSDTGGPAGRNNNPGNITVDDNVPDAWNPDIGAYQGRNTDGRYAIFPTYTRGRAGAIACATKRRNLSLLEYFKIYAPSSEKGNNPQSYADMVAEVISASGKPVDSGTKINTIISYGAMDAFVNGQERAEGFTKSNVKLVSKDSPELPQAVRDFVAGFDSATGGTSTIARNVAASAVKEHSP